MSAAAMALRSAEEIAREMVPDAAPDEECGYVLTLAVGDDGGGLVLRRCWSDAGARRERELAVTLLAGEIEQARADGAAALAGQQPRDLAGRIRTLALETTGRWVDEPYQDVAGGYDEVLRTLRECLVGLRSGVPGTAQACIDALRREAALSTPPLGEPFRHAADQLEQIVRDCEAHQ